MQRSSPIYTSGTISGTIGDTVVYGTQTGWSITDAQGNVNYSVAAYDELICGPNRALTIKSVDGPGQITLFEPLPFGIAPGSSYIIIQRTPIASNAAVGLVQRLLGQGSDTYADAYRTFDNGVTRARLDFTSAGLFRIRVRASNAADSAYTDCILIDPATGLVTANGLSSGGGGALFNTIRTTVGAPANNVGTQGDYAIDALAKTLYGPKALGSWPAGIPLNGASADLTTLNTAVGLAQTASNTAVSSATTATTAATASSASATSATASATSATASATSAAASAASAAASATSAQSSVISPKAGYFLPGVTTTSPILDIIRGSDGKAAVAVTSDSMYAPSPSGLDQVLTATTSPDTFKSSQVFIPGVPEAVVSYTIDPSTGRCGGCKGVSGTEYVATAKGLVPGTTTRSATDFDVIIYGSSVSGQMAAVRAKNRGLKVAVLESSHHFGGMHAAGLTYMDQPRDLSVLGGDTFNTYLAGIVAIDGQSSHRYAPEAKTAEKNALAILSAYTDLMLRDVRINSRNDVVTSASVTGTAIKGIVTNQLGLLTAKTFIDCSYELDLARFSGAPCVTGRESAAAYNESLAGFNGNQAQTTTGVAFIDSASADPMETQGQADGLVQSYNWRIPMTRTVGNIIPFPKPSGYSSTLIRTELAYIAARGYNKFARDYTTGNFGFQGTTAGQKLNFNTLDLLDGTASVYTNGLWSVRDTCVQNAYLWTASVLWAIQKDPIMQTLGPTAIALQADAADIGLCADEFPDSPFSVGWPHGYYIRESWRLSAKKFLTQGDLMLGGNTKSTSIGKWSYAWDAHPMQQYAPNGTSNTLVREGYITGPDPVVFQVPMEALMPPDGTVTNLTVGFCAGFSHVAWAPARMELFGGIMGEACGEMAYLQCFHDGQTIQQTNYAELAALLTSRGSVL